MQKTDRTGTPETNNTRDKAEVMGLFLGTCDGWDLIDTLNLVFYDFIPSLDFSKLPKGDINFDFTSGTINYFDDDGVLIRTFNMVEVLTHSYRTTAIACNDLDESDQIKDPLGQWLSR